MKSLYFECNFGISGDMAIAAMLDAGADKNYLLETLNTIPVEGFKIEIGRVKKNGIDCCDFNVLLDEAHENHDHDMKYLFGHEACAHHNEHTHSHGEHHHNHEHRTLTDIIKIIDGTKMSSKAKKLTLEIFNIIAESESHAHGIPIEQVHFHEVGALDSIVDVIALAVCFENLSRKFGIKNVYIPCLCEGYGTVRCQHGILSVPVPAVANIVARCGLNLSFINAQGEFVTPTGAAFAAAIFTSQNLPAKFKIEKIGLGAGKRDYGLANIVRAFIIEENSVDCATRNSSGFLYDEVVKLEANIDDCTGENMGFLMELLFENGALEVYFVPCFMKKNRPAYFLTVLCKEENRVQLERMIFTHSTTIGIRYSKMERTILLRKIQTVETEWGTAEVKVVEAEGLRKVYPEYESVRKISIEQNIPFDEVYRKIASEKFQS